MEHTDMIYYQQWCQFSVYEVTSVDPVKPTLSTPGWVAIIWPNDPGPVTTLNTPAAYSHDITHAGANMLIGCTIPSRTPSQLADQEAGRLRHRSQQTAEHSIWCRWQASAPLCCPWPVLGTPAEETTGAAIGEHIESVPHSTLQWTSRRKGGAVP